MSEYQPENDFRENVQDMPPEASVALSQSHLLRRALEHGQYHVLDGRVVVDDSQSSEDEQRKAELQALQLKISREEAGQRRRGRYPEAS